jgi:hypothetical protein
LVERPRPGLRASRRESTVLRGLRVAGPGENARNRFARPLMPLASRSEFTFEPTVHRPARPKSRMRRTPSMRFSALRRLRNAGSDPRRVCLARLCCAFRFSQPLDALFHPPSFRPYFMPVTPLGFLAFREFPLPIAATPFDARCPSCRCLPRCLHSRVNRNGDTLNRLQGFMHSGGPFRASSRS